MLHIYVNRRPCSLPFRASALPRFPAPRALPLTESPEVCAFESQVVLLDQSREPTSLEMGIPEHFSVPRPRLRNVRNVTGIGCEAVDEERWKSLSKHPQRDFK